MSIISKTLRKKVIELSRSENEPEKNENLNINNENNIYKDKDINNNRNKSLFTLNYNDKYFSNSINKSQKSKNTSFFLSTPKINSKKNRFSRVNIYTIISPNIQLFTNSFNHTYTTPSFKSNITKKKYHSYKKNKYRTPHSPRYKDIKFNKEEKKIVNGNTKEGIQLAFNKLYNINENTEKKINRIKNRKSLSSLDGYQNILMNFSAKNCSNKNFDTMEKNMKEIRHLNEGAMPLPKINIKNIIDHVKKQKKKSEQNHLNIQEILYGLKKNDLDNYEKEEKIIQSMKTQRVLKKSKRNYNLYNLPPILISAFENRK